MRLRDARMCLRRSSRLEMRRRARRATWRARRRFAIERARSLRALPWVKGYRSVSDAEVEKRHAEVRNQHGRKNAARLNLDATQCATFFGGSSFAQCSHVTRHLRTMSPT